MTCPGCQQENPQRRERMRHATPTAVITMMIATVLVFAPPVSVHAEPIPFVLYASSTFDDTIYRIDAKGAVSIFASGLGRPHEIELAPNGDLFVAELAGHDVVTRITPNGNRSTYFDIGQAYNGSRSNPEGLALRDDGTLFVTGTIDCCSSNFSPNYVVAIAPDATSSSVFATVGNQENLSVAIDRLGNLFVSENGDNGSVWQVLPNGQSFELVAGLGGRPFGVA